MPEDAAPEDVMPADVMKAGRFVVFEGGEGVGKTTQLARLAARLRAGGEEVVETREPGGSPGAEAVRALLVSGDVGRWSALSELYLVLAARADHVARVVRPALDRGAWVLCDRFVDSTRAYQGVAGGLGVALVDRLHEPLSAMATPDLVVLLDAPIALGLGRRAAAGGGGRIEAKGEAFHERVRAALCDGAARDPERFAVIDADAPIDAVADAIEKAVAARFGAMGDR